MNHQVQQVGDAYYRGVVCGNCLQRFVVCIHNVEKVLLKHVCVPNPDPRVFHTNG